MAERFDAVLLDAPCSATGTIRRHPELPYIRQRSQITALCATQRNMLTEAADRVSPGGSLVYCTCSLEPEEGENQISWFLAAYPHFRLVKPGPAIPGNLVSDSGWLRTHPAMRIGGYSGMDGFFAARLDRTR
jgi:16S rRNA (cytosine967-C5)-methyltransferase